MIFYAWCGFLAFILLSIPIAVFLDGRGGSSGGAAPIQDDMVDDGEVIEDAGFVEDAEVGEIEEGVEMAEPVEEGEFAEFEELQ